MTTTRDEHVARCKRRALEYLDDGDLVNAVMSMASDMSKHPECGCPPVLLMLGGMHATNGDRAGVRRWIEGFH